MSNPSPVTGRYVVPFEDAEALIDAVEETEQTRPLKAVTLRRCGIRGVPLRRMDVMIQERPAFDPPRHVVVIETARKRGRYDRAERPRLCVRYMTRTGARGAGLDGARLHRLSVRAPTDAVRRCRIEIVAPGGQPVWVQTVEAERLALDPAHDQARIVHWHARRYYRHLTDEAVASVAGEFTTTLGDSPEWYTLAAANRLASRLLYRASRDLGWRKLTARERERLGLDHAGQWIHESQLAGLLPAWVGRPTVGQHTEEAAAGAPTRPGVLDVRRRHDS